MRKKLFHKIMDQSGRSLSEMLGVLAVIGVLTLMGVYGFSYAMEKWRENETFDRYSKVVAGARTSRILENEGYWTLWKRDETNPDVHKKRDGYVSQPISMNQVISNIGDDLCSDEKGECSSWSGYHGKHFIFAPLKGPYNMFNKPTDGSDWTEDQEQEVEIWVKVQNPQAFTVHATNLTEEACKRIVRANFGYSWAYGDDTTSSDTTPNKTDCGDGEGWCEYAEVKNNVAEQLCQNTLNNGELVLWFGPYSDTIGSWVTPPDECEGGRQRCSYPAQPCKTGEFCGDDNCCHEGGTDEECDSGKACNEYGMCSGDLKCGDDGCCHEPKECNEANACYIDGDTPVCCGDGERCYRDAQLCCTAEAEEFCYTDDDDIPVCCVNGEECKDGACVWSGEFCPDNSPKGECSCSEGQTCEDGCCVCLDGADACTSGDNCGSGICVDGCCKPEQTDPEDVCDSGNPKPECGKDDDCSSGICVDGCCKPEQDVCDSRNPKPECREDASCGEGYYCDIEGCCKKFPECDKDNNEELYCMLDSSAGIKERCNASYCMYATRCVEWGCTTANLLQDETMTSSIASGYDDKPGWREDSRARDREIPMEGNLAGKYPYCSLRLRVDGDDRCVVVSYCDESPVSSDYTGPDGSIYATQMCPACGVSYNPEEFVCVGSDLKTGAVDGVDVLIHYYPVGGKPQCLEADMCQTDEECGEDRICQEKCCKAIGGQCAEDSLQCETDTDCEAWAEENPAEGATKDAVTVAKCVNGCCAASCLDRCTAQGSDPYYDDKGNLQCCPAEQSWFNCGKCENNPTPPDACSVPRPQAKACCKGSSNAPEGCSDTGTWDGRHNKNTVVGDRMPQCYTNYPDSNNKCCDLACLADGGGTTGYESVCCDENKGDKIMGGVCCQGGISKAQSALCCGASGGAWIPDSISDDENNAKGLKGKCCDLAKAYIDFSQKGAPTLDPICSTSCTVYHATDSHGDTQKEPIFETKFPVNATVEVEIPYGIECCNGDLPFYDGETDTAACCPASRLAENDPADSVPFTHGKCCAPGEEPYGDAQCCPAAQLAGTSGIQKCCPVDKTPYTDANGDGGCCEAAQLAGTFGIQKCCSVGQTPYTDANGDGGCCEEGEIWDDTQQQCVAACENGTIMECPSDEEVSTSGGTGMGCVKLNIQFDPETGVKKEMCCCSGGEPSEETTTPETTTPETTTPETTTPETTTPETTTPETTTPETTTPETTTPETTTPGTITTTPGDIIPDTTTPETTTPGTTTTTPGDIIPDTTTPGGIILDTTTPETTTPETTTPGDIILDTTIPETTTPGTTTTTPGTTTTTPGDIIPDTTTPETTTPGTITTTTTTETTVTETTTPGGVTPGETSTTTTATETTVTETTTPETTTPEITTPETTTPETTTPGTTTTTTPRWWENSDVTIETDISDPYALETESYSW